MVIYTCPPGPEYISGSWNFLGKVFRVMKFFMKIFPGHQKFCHIFPGSPNFSMVSPGSWKFFKLLMPGSWNYYWSNTLGYETFRKNAIWPSGHRISFKIIIKSMINPIWNMPTIFRLYCLFESIYIAAKLKYFLFEKKKHFFTFEMHF